MAHEEEGAVKTRGQNRAVAKKRHQSRTWWVKKMMLFTETAEIKAEMFNYEERKYQTFSTTAFKLTLAGIWAELKLGSSSQAGNY